MLYRTMRANFWHWKEIVKLTLRYLWCGDSDTATLLCIQMTNSFNQKDAESLAEYFKAISKLG